MATGGPWSRCALKATTGFRRQNPSVWPSRGLVDKISHSSPGQDLDWTARATKELSPNERLVHIFDSIPLGLQ